MNEKELVGQLTRFKLRIYNSDPSNLEKDTYYILINGNAGLRDISLQITE